jgi:hypothetical protein
MNLRAYLRLLRPVHSLALVSMSGLLFFPCWMIFFSNRPNAVYLGVAVWLSPVLGFCLAGAAHDLMHRPNVMVLPGGLRWIRQMTVFAVLLFTSAMSVIMALAGAPFHPMATFGLAAGLLALPSTSCHRPRDWTWGFCFLISWVILCALASKGFLLSAMVTAPSVVLVGGLVVATASIAHGFSRGLLRQRAATVYRAPQTLFTLNVARGPARNAHLGVPQSPGRPWSVRAVTSSTQSWMQVLSFGAFGFQRRGGVGGLIWTGVMLTVATQIGISLADLYINGWNFQAARYWAKLAETAAITPTDGHHEMGSYWMMWICLLSLTFIRPTLAYPVSRARLARAVFGLKLICWAGIWIAATLVAWMCSLFGQTMSNHFLPAYGAAVLGTQCAAMAVMVLPICCLSTVYPSVTFNLTGPVAGSVGGRIVVFLIVQVMYFALSGLRESWLPYALTPMGGVTIMFFGVGGIALLWNCLRRQYRTCDLVETLQR